MNEHVHKILLNMSSSVGESGNSLLTEEAITLFTSLIIEESINVMRTTKTEWPYAAADYSAAIKKHFGV